MRQVAWITACLVFLTSPFLFGEDCEADLENFFRRLCLDSESGYVFFGSKPASYWVVDKFPAHFPGTPSHQMEAMLRKGAAIWLHQVELGDGEKSFVLRVKEREDSFEFLSLNRDRVLEVVRNNLALFQYVLGPEITPEALFYELAYGDASFYSIVHEDNALVGILLGFGTTNSILGARHEVLSSEVQAPPEFPGYPLWQPPSEEEGWNYLGLSLFFKGNFNIHGFKRTQPSFGFASISQELKYLDALHERAPQLIDRYVPRLIFNRYRGSAENESLVRSYSDEQRAVIEMLNQSSFYAAIKDKLGIVSVYQPESMPHASPSDLANAVVLELRRGKFFDPYGAMEAINDHFQGKDPRYDRPDLDHFYKLWTLQQMEKWHDVSLLKMKQLKEGEGLLLNASHSKAAFNYALFLGEEQDLFPDKVEKGVVLDLNQTIPGVALSVQQMRQGEIREVWIPRSLAYGAFLDFDGGNRIRLRIELISIDQSSPPLKIQAPCLSAERPLQPSPSEKREAAAMQKALSYCTVRDFYSFYNPQLASQEEHVSALHDALVADAHPFDFSAINEASLVGYREKMKDEAARAERALTSSGQLTYATKAFDRSTPPKKIQLEYRDLEGRLLAEINFDSLVSEEIALLPAPLREFINRLAAGDTGTILIPPSIESSSLFRNPHAGKALRVHFKAD